MIGEIFLGDIKTWNDPKIAALNEGVELPATAISVFFRSDESGTTDNFQKYLAGSAPDVWKSEPPRCGRARSAAASPSPTVWRRASRHRGWHHLRRVELRHLEQPGCRQIDNGGGAVELTGESAGKALTAAEVAGEGNDLKLKLDYATKEAGVYPAVLVTYEIVCSKGLDADKTTLVKAFLKHFSSTETQTSLQAAGYAPLPAEIQTKVQAAVEAIS